MAGILSPFLGLPARSKMLMLPKVQKYKWLYSAGRDRWSWAEKSYKSYHPASAVKDLGVGWQDGDACLLCADLSPPCHRYYNKLRSLLKDPSRECVLFANEYHASCYHAWGKQMLKKDWEKRYGHLLWFSCGHLLLPHWKLI